MYIKILFLCTSFRVGSKLKTHLASFSFIIEKTGQLNNPAEKIILGVAVALDRLQFSQPQRKAVRRERGNRFCIVQKFQTSD